MLVSRLKIGVGVPICVVWVRLVLGTAGSGNSNIESMGLAQGRPFGQDFEIGSPIATFEDKLDWVCLALFS